MDVGCRKIADTFNHLHAHRGETVGHFFVAMLVKSEAEKVQRLRREIKHRKPGRLPRNLIWALDLTFLPGPSDPRAVFALVDHGSRLCLALRELRDRSTIGVLRLLLDAIDHFGRPRRLRTDNEPVLASRLFRFVLWLLGIRHQRTAPHCPWQYGRIERLFRTVKEPLLGWFDEVGVPELLDEDLAAVRTWYNHLRPHQHLGGLTPAMAWTGRKPTGLGTPGFVSLWNGRLSGYLFPP
jgi:transposase InsO family protein